MNGYALLILGCLAGEYILNVIADLLNLKEMQSNLPEEFNGVYDQEAYQKSQDYSRILLKWGLLKSTGTLLLFLVFWFSGGFHSLDQFVRHLHFGLLISGLIYFGILFLLSSLLSLPVNIIETFVIEEKFGFNRTRPVTFVFDTLKGWGLTILVGTPLLSGILYFFEWAGSSAWWFGWVMTSIIQLLIQWVGPSLIMPLFNRFDPLENGNLKDSIIAYGRKVNFPIDNIYVMDGSKRSSKGNAFFSGFGRRKRIALFDTLIKKQTTPELVAVLAHEIGHFKRKHVIKGTILSVLNTGILFYILSLFINRPGLSEAFYVDHPSLYCSLVFFLLLYAPMEFMLSLLFLMYSRRNEFEADRYAVETLADPNSMVSALKKLAVDNLANLNPHPFHVFLKDSHPPILERIEAIRQVRQV
ncbi:MAG: M48 family metallopeptidase [Nitrospiria bacterium]